MSERIKNGVIVMTALPPTVGHAALVEWAGHFLRSINDGRYYCGQLYVIVNTRTCEPSNPDEIFDRVRAMREHFRYHHLGSNIEFIEDQCDDAPQNPSEHPDFWNWWKDRIHSILGQEEAHWSDDELVPVIQPGDYLFASEQYGHELAEVMELTFVPYDMHRDIIPSRATEVRQNVMYNWDKLLHITQRQLRQRVTIFGAESCGKTTMTQKLYMRFVNPELKSLVTPIPEWARPYLEEVGAEVTPEKMDTIMRGQWALQRMFMEKCDTPFLVQDTDLLSTIGYYKIMGIDMPPEIEELAFETGVSSHLYIVMNSNIPFEQDPLRYGGDKRESSDQFWIDLLDHYQLKYHVVKATDPELQFAEVCQAMIDSFNTDYIKALRSFVRT